MTTWPTLEQLERCIFPTVEAACAASADEDSVFVYYSHDSLLPSFRVVRAPNFDRALLVVAVAEGMRQRVEIWQLGTLTIDERELLDAALAAPKEPYHVIAQILDRVSVLYHNRDPYGCGGELVIGAPSEGELVQCAELFGEHFPLLLSLLRRPTIVERYSPEGTFPKFIEPEVTPDTDLRNSLLRAIENRVRENERARVLSETLLRGLVALNAAAAQEATL